MGLLAARRRAESTDQDAGARYSLFVAPRGGIARIVEALAARLPPGTIELGSPIERVERDGDGRWRLGRSGTFDRLIIATPAHAASRLLESVDAKLASDLRGIPYAGCAIVLVGYRRQQIAHPLDGFGFVVPEIENRRILAASFSSNKFPGRAPEDCVLLRVFVGGARHPELVELSDDGLRRIVAEELSDILSASGEPRLFHVTRWRNAMPQYHLGHTELVRQIEARVATLPGLSLAGNAYHGVGIPDCVHSGELAAEAILRQPAKPQAPAIIPSSPVP
jgi:oxygen-dependent protoporphyrinogen oxidase